ncbi:MAG: hypothetical protein ACI8UO_001806 [Verrucomicrobiales bacterium]|jgi:hypothetical protein
MWADVIESFLMKGAGEEALVGDLIELSRIHGALAGREVSVRFLANSKKFKG